MCLRGIRYLYTSHAYVSSIDVGELFHGASVYGSMRFRLSSIFLHHHSISPQALMKNNAKPPCVLLKFLWHTGWQFRTCMVLKARDARCPGFLLEQPVGELQKRPVKATCMACLLLLVRKSECQSLVPCLHDLYYEIEQNGCLENDPFVLGFGNFSGGELLNIRGGI